MATSAAITSVAITSVATHDGYYHLDEVMAVGMLSLLKRFDLNILLERKICRTRDPKVLATADIVVDVGGTYDPAAGKFDHHQAGFQAVFPGRTATKLSSAGLIWLHYGKEIITDYYSAGVSPEHVDEIHNQVYDQLIVSIDANDNGVSDHDNSPKFARLPSLAKMIHILSDTDALGNCVAQDTAFYAAVPITVTTLIHYMNLIREQQELICQLTTIVSNTTKRHIVLPRDANWRDVIHRVPGTDSLLYVIYPGIDGRGWKVMCVPHRGNHFSNRLPLPNAWWGLSGKNLTDACGIQSAQFVHLTGFIGGASSMEGAVQMAESSIAMQESPSQAGGRQP